MLTRYALILLLSLPAFAQVDFSILPSTRPFTMGDPAPTTCQQGQMFFSTAAPPGANVFSCDANNTWTVVGTGTPAVLSTVASSGNYSDLLNIPLFSRVAMSGLYTDLLNAPAFLLPSGNAASATKLAATPIACLAGRYAISITASGNSNCAQVQYSQIGGTPPAYSLPQSSSTVLGGVKAGTGLSSTLGVLAVKYGTVAGTAAQGNDSRILGALQKATALSDLKLIGSTPVTINSPTTGKAGSAGVADIARKLQGTGPLQMKSLCGTAPLATTGLIDLYLDTDCNLHLKDAANLNRAVMVWTWKNGVEQKCDQSKGLSAFIDFSASGIPECSVPLPTPPVGVTVSGSSCMITSIVEGKIMGASCTP